MKEIVDEIEVLGESMHDRLPNALLNGGPVWTLFVLDS